jgi:hypothetical protein
VAEWTSEDGWLNSIQFVEGMRGVTPLVWSGKRAQGASDGGAADVVGWAYERREGGRSFAYTGIDAHAAWAAASLRRLLVNAVLWTAGVDVPATGAPSDLPAAGLDAYLTPRTARSLRPLRSLRKAARRVMRSRW